MKTSLRPTVKGFFDDTTHTWSYVVWAEGHGDNRCAVIDSVLDFDVFSHTASTKNADQLLDFVTQNNLTVQWILETHIHADHLSAAAYLKEKTGAKIAIGTRVQEVLEACIPLLESDLHPSNTLINFDHFFEDDEVFDIGPLHAHILATPGHTPSDVCYLIEDTVFVGDTLFLPDVGTGRCDFPGGCAEQAYESVQKILNLPGSTRIFVGHDYPPQGARLPACESSVYEQRKNNIRLQNTTKNEYVAKRQQDDRNKPQPKLLRPSLQANLRAGALSKS